MGTNSEQMDIDGVQMPLGPPDGSLVASSLPTSVDSPDDLPNPHHGSMPDAGTMGDKAMSADKAVPVGKGMVGSKAMGEGTASRGTGRRGIAGRGSRGKDAASGVTTTVEATAGWQPEVVGGSATDTNPTRLEGKANRCTIGVAPNLTMELHVSTNMAS